MSYNTRYDGEITLTNNKCKSLIKNILFDDSDCDGTGNDYANNLFESKLKNNILVIHEDRRNYNEEMESLFSLIAHFDEGATGIIIGVGEDGKGKERFILKNGKVFQENGFIGYNNKIEISGKYIDEGEIEELEEQLERFEGIIICNRCDGKVSGKFVFENRGYYDEIIEGTNYKKTCEKCYKELKIPFAKKRKIENELRKINEEVEKLKWVDLLLLSDVGY